MPPQGGVGGGPLPFRRRAPSGPGTSVLGWPSIRSHPRSLPAARLPRCRPCAVRLWRGGMWPLRRAGERQSPARWCGAHGPRLAVRLDRGLRAGSGRAGGAARAGGRVPGLGAWRAVLRWSCRDADLTWGGERSAAAGLIHREERGVLFARGTFCLIAFNCVWSGGVMVLTYICWNLSSPGV